MTDTADIDEEPRPATGAEDPSPEEVKAHLADQMGLAPEEVTELLEKLSPVQIEDGGARPTVYVRPVDARPLPTGHDPQAAYSRRIDGQFIAAERMERWVFRAVALAIFATLITAC